MSRVWAFVVFSAVPIFVLWFGGELPDRVASHFNVTGLADGFMPREVFVLAFSLVAAGAPQLIRWSLVRTAHDARRSRGDEAATRAEFVVAAAVRADALAIALSVFLGYLYALVVRANLMAPGPPTMNMPAFFGGLIVFVLFCAVWYRDHLRLNKSFGRSV